MFSWFVFCCGFVDVVVLYLFDKFLRMVVILFFCLYVCLIFVSWFLFLMVVIFNVIFGWVFVFLCFSVVFNCSLVLKFVRMVSMNVKLWFKKYVIFLFVLFYRV